MEVTSLSTILITMHSIELVYKKIQHFTSMQLFIIGICCLIGYVIFLNKDYLINKIKHFFGFDAKKKYSFTVKGKLIHNTHFVIDLFPEEFKAIMYYLYKKKIDIQKGTKLSFQSFYHKKQEAPYEFLLENNKEIKIDDDIYVIQTSTTEKSNDLKIKNDFYELTIYSPVYNFDKIKEKISDWMKIYHEFLRDNSNGNIYYFSYLGTEKGENNNTMINSKLLFESHKFSTNKSFDNIFFEQKDELINRIEYFKNNKKEYERLGIPYTLGLLFHGLPGCGKTSCIKAIASYMDRHVIEISLSRVKTCSELKKIFFSDCINNIYIPSNKKIIVLEDIDCMIDIVKERGDEKGNMDDNDLREKLDGIVSDEIKKDVDSKEITKNIVSKLLNAKNLVEKKNDDDKLNLSFVLNLLDGVLEQPDRMLIISSNFPEKLDKALIRPGRIDKKIHFAKASFKIVHQIMTFFFKNEMNFKEFKKIILKDVDEKYTPAEVFELCFNNSNLIKAIKKLNS